MTTGDDNTREELITVPKDGFSLPLKTFSKPIFVLAKCKYVQPPGDFLKILTAPTRHFTYRAHQISLKNYVLLSFINHSYISFYAYKQHEMCQL